MATAPKITPPEDDAKVDTKATEAKDTDTLPKVKDFVDAEENVEKDPEEENEEELTAPSDDETPETPVAPRPQPVGDGPGEQIGALANGVGAGIGAAAAGAAVGLGHLLRPTANVTKQGAVMAGTALADRHKAKKVKDLGAQLKLIEGQRIALEEKLAAREAKFAPYVSQVERAMSSTKLTAKYPNAEERRAVTGLALEAEFPEVATPEFKANDVAGLKEIEKMSKDHADSLKN